MDNFNSLMVEQKKLPTPLLLFFIFFLYFVLLIFYILFVILWIKANALNCYIKSFMSFPILEIKYLSLCFHYLKINSHIF